MGFGRGRAAQAGSEAIQYFKKWSHGIGADNVVKTLDNYYDMKYNGSPEFPLLQQYARDVQNGWISPLSSFENYLALYDRIQSEIVGREQELKSRISKKHFFPRKR